MLVLVLYKKAKIFRNGKRIRDGTKNRLLLMFCDLVFIYAQHIYIYLNTLREHFIRDTCTPTNSCKYLISQAFGGSAMLKIMQIRANSFG